MKFVCKAGCGNCCRVLAIPLGHTIVGPHATAKKDFYQARGLRVVWTDNTETLWALVPHRCPHLTQGDNLCEIYDTKKWPDNCRHFIGLKYSFVKCQGKFVKDEE